MSKIVRLTLSLSDALAEKLEADNKNALVHKLLEDYYHIEHGHKPPTDIRTIHDLLRDVSILYRRYTRWHDSNSNYYRGVARDGLVGAINRLEVVLERLKAHRG